VDELEKCSLEVILEKLAVQELNQRLQRKNLLKEITTIVISVSAKIRE